MKPTASDKVLKLYREDKSIEQIKSVMGFKSNGSVYHHLNKFKIRPVRLTEAEIVLLRGLMTEMMSGTPSSEFTAEMVSNINQALKLAEAKR